MSDTDEVVATDTAIAQVLIDAGANVNTAGNDGAAPLGMSMGAHSLKFVTLLIDHGADVNARSASVASPLSKVMGLEQLSPVMGLDTQDYSAIEALLRAHGAVQ